MVLNDQDVHLARSRLTVGRELRMTHRRSGIAWASGQHPWSDRTA